MTRLLFVLCFCTSLTYGQNINTTVQSGSLNIYNDALKRFLPIYLKTYKSKLDTLFVIQNGIFADSITSEIEGHRVILLDTTEQAKLINQDKDFVTNYISPLEFDDGQFYIKIESIIAYKDEGKYKFFTHGVCSVIYLYDNKKKYFTFLKTTWLGH